MKILGRGLFPKILNAPVGVGGGVNPLTRYITTMSAGDSTYNEFQTAVVLSGDFEIEFKFSTESTTTEYLLGQTQYIRTQSDGTVRFSLGSSITTTNSYNDGILYTVNVKRIGSDITYTIGDEELTNSSSSSITFIYTHRAYSGYCSAFMIDLLIWNDSDRSDLIVDIPFDEDGSATEFANGANANYYLVRYNQLPENTQIYTLNSDTNPEQWESADGNITIPIFSTEMGLLRVWLQSGQSLSTGNTDASNPIIHTSELSGAYLFSGMNPYGLGGTAADSSDVSSLKPYQELYKETHGWAAINKTIQLLDDGSEFLFAPHGSGGYSITQLSDPSTPWDNAVLEISSINSAAESINSEVRIEFIDWIHGEANSGTASSVYLSDLRDLHNDYIAQVNGATGQTELPMLLDQSGAPYAHNIAKTSLKYAEQNSDAFLVCPNYMLNRYYHNTVSDSTHLKPEGYVIKGEYHAIAAHSLITTGEFKCLQPESFDVVGNTIEITMNVPVPPMVIDTTILPSAPGYGFVYQKSGGGDITPTVSISGNKIILDIGESPISGSIIDCGYTLNDPDDNDGFQFPCANIRDSQNVSSEISGLTLYNWIVQFDYEI